MTEPKVSVIVPTFNRAHCVGRAIGSALAQTHQNIEIILIDDGSTDNTQSMIAQKFGSDGRVKYFHQSNQGVTAARNQGLARATGDFVALLDSDDYWMPWKIQLQLACMRKFPELGMVWTDMQAVAPDGSIAHEKYLNKMYGCYSQFTIDEIFSKHVPLSDFIPSLPDATTGGSIHTGLIYPKMFMGSLVHTSTVLLRRERLEKVKGFNEELKRSGEDYDFHLRTSREGPVGLIDVSCIQYQIGMPDRLTDRKWAVTAVTNVLKTITMAYERDGEKLGLTRGMIDQRFCDVHAWLGSVQLAAGNRVEARKHLAKSLRLNPWQRECTQDFVLACMPQAVTDSLRSIYRWMKKSDIPMQSAQHRPT